MPRHALRRYMRHGLFPQLTVFEAVARLGSVTRAAEALHLAQPTVSLQLRKLSETLEVQLFEQRGRNLCLTRAGRELQSICEELIELLLRAEARLAPLRNGHGDAVRIAAAPGARHIAARLLASFCARYPGLQASLHVANRSELMHRLDSGEDDLYLFAVPDDMVGVKAYPIASEELRFYAPASHALARKSVPLAALADEPFAVREAGSGTRKLLKALFDRHGLRLRVRLELPSDEAIADAVAAGVALGLLPCPVADGKPAAETLAPIKVEGMALERCWSLAHRAEQPLPAAALLFLREALESASPQAKIARIPNEGEGSGHDARTSP